MRQSCSDKKDHDVPSIATVLQRINDNDDAGLDLVLCEKIAEASTHDFDAET